jgi:hypothetical protein
MEGATSTRTSFTNLNDEQGKTPIFDICREITFRGDFFQTTQESPPLIFAPPISTQQLHYKLLTSMVTCGLTKA